MSCSAALVVRAVSQQLEYERMFESALDCKGSNEERLMVGCQHLFRTKYGPQTSDNILNTQ